MKTSEALFRQYGKKFVPLQQISEEYLGITDAATLSKKAGKNDLNGIRAFRLGSAKSKWMVDIDQLADLLDSKSRG